MGRVTVNGDEEDWRRPATRRGLIVLALVMIGLAIVIAGRDAVEIVGWAVVGAALTIGVGFVFLEIGYSEDRERLREARRRDSQPPF